jgi:hypothetical protein
MMLSSGINALDLHLLAERFDEKSSPRQFQHSDVEHLLSVCAELPQLYSTQCKMHSGDSAAAQSRHPLLQDVAVSLD